MIIMETKAPSRELVIKSLGNARIGTADPMRLIQTGLLKHACGYPTGSMVACVLQELGLLKRNPRGDSRALPELTKKGGCVLYEWYGRATPRDPSKDSHKIQKRKHRPKITQKEG